MKIAVVTPYFREDKDTLVRCLDSVRTQTLACDHFLISDGHPQDFIDGEAVRHLRLGMAHGDYGNTPRGLGAQLAVSEGYQAIAFLDADNWYENNHLEVCLDAARTITGDAFDCDYVIARRRFISPDQKIVFLGDEPDSVDTNCYFFLPGAYHMLPYWNLMPKEASEIGDHLFYRHLQAKKLLVARTEQITVNYLNLWAHTYVARRLPPPEGAKPRVSIPKVAEWFVSQPPRRSEILKRLMGVWFER